MPIRHFTRHGLADQRRQHTVYVPVDFDIARCVRPELHKYEQQARYILHTIYLRRLVVKTRDERHANRPVNLKWAYLHSMVPCGRKLAAVLKDMKDSGAITCDGKQIGGKKSYGYALGPLFSHRFRRTTISDKFLCQKMVTAGIIDEEALPLVHRWLLNNLRHGHHRCYRCRTAYR